METKLKLVVAPGPSEIDDAKNINAVSILDKGKALRYFSTCKFD